MVLQERGGKWMYLGVVLDGFLDYGGDGELALSGHDWVCGASMELCLGSGQALESSGHLVKYTSTNRVHANPVSG